MAPTEDLVDVAWQARREGRHEDAERGLLEIIKNALSLLLLVAPSSVPACGRLRQRHRTAKLEIG
jgi:hypothetical protein